MTEQILHGWLQTSLGVSLLLGVWVTLRFVFPKLVGARAYHSGFLLLTALLLLGVIPTSPFGLVLDRPASAIQTNAAFSAASEPVVTEDLANASPLELMNRLSIPKSTEATSASPLERLLAPKLLLGIWLAGSLLFGAQWLVRELAARRQRQASLQPWGDRISAIRHHCCVIAGVRRVPALRVTEENGSAAICGWFHPVILIPPSLLRPENEETLRSALLHELCHLRRGDLWWIRLATMARTLMWWNPVIHLAAVQARRDMEINCDSEVCSRIGNDDGVVGYGLGLLQMVRLAALSSMRPGGMAAFTRQSTEVKRRIRAIADWNPNHRRMRAAMGCAVFILLWAMLAPRQSIGSRHEVADNSDSPELFVHTAYRIQTRQGAETDCPAPLIPQPTKATLFRAVDPLSGDESRARKNSARFRLMRARNEG